MSQWAIKLDRDLHTLVTIETVLQKTLEQAKNLMTEVPTV